MSAGFPTPWLLSLPGARGKSIATPGGASLGVFRFDSDPIGTRAVAFDGVHAGSEIRVYLPDGTEAAGIESCATNQVLSWNAYAAGNSNNTVTIRIIHMQYKTKEFDVTLSGATVLLPIQQEKDPWFSNP